jgi:hypothetical protein
MKRHPEEATPAVKVERSTPSVRKSMSTTSSPPPLERISATHLQEHLLRVQAEQRAAAAEQRLREAEDRAERTEQQFQMNGNHRKEHFAASTSDNV